MRRTEGKTRSVLRQRLEARRGEIEEAALTRVYAIADPGEAPDPAYGEGLRSSVWVALEYALEALERGEEGTPPPVPVSLLAQARLAARNGVTLDYVLRRYFAGYSLLSYFVVEEAGKDGLMDSAELKRLAATAAGLFDRLIEAIGEDHAREAQARLVSSRQRQAEQVERLLAGEMIDTSAIPYDFEGWHLGVVATGAGAEEGVLELAEPRDCRLLIVPREGTVSAWLGTRRGPDALGLDRLGSSSLPENAAFALGEPGEGLAGWRLTHRQAAAASRVTRRDDKRAVRYGEVALLASVLRDDLLADSLVQLYLGPLEQGRDGEVLRATLDAYLDHERNSASTAAALGVTRQTVNNRLRLIQERIGQPLSTCMSEIEVALRLSEDRRVFRGASGAARR